MCSQLPQWVLTVLFCVSSEFGGDSVDV
jgi:hypothetical protein